MSNKFTWLRAFEQYRKVVSTSFFLEHICIAHKRANKSAITQSSSHTPDYP